MLQCEFTLRIYMESLMAHSIWIKYCVTTKQFFSSVNDVSARFSSVARQQTSVSTWRCYTENVSLSNYIALFSMNEKHYKNLHEIERAFKRNGSMLDWLSRSCWLCRLSAHWPASCMFTRSFCVFMKGLVTYLSVKQNRKKCGVV